MKAEGKSLSFLQGAQILKVPFFQRPYVWDEENWQDLLDDLSMVDSTNFLGSIIFKEDNSGTGGLRRSFIIDGQQRLTTISILIKALYDTFPEDIKENCKSALIDMLFYKKSKTSPDYYVKLEHSYSDKEAFYEVIGRVENGNIVSSLYEEIDNIVDDERISLIKRCYKYFCIKVLDKSPAERMSIFDSILDETKEKIVVIDLKEKENEQQIFDTINSAGVRLTSTDIIKNSLFQQLLSMSQDDEDVIEFYKETWGKAFLRDSETSSYWSLKKNKNRKARDHGEFLLQSIAVIRGWCDEENSDVDISEIYKKRIKDFKVDQLKSFIREIVKYAQLYRKHFVDFDENKDLTWKNGGERLLHIITIYDPYAFTPYILYLYGKYTDQKILIEKLFELEKLVMRRMIIKQNIRMGKDECKEFIKDETKVKKALDEEDLSYAEIKKAFYRNFKHTSSSSTMFKLILFWIELYRRSLKPDHYSQTLKYEYTLEHILPQNYQKEEAWSEQMVPIPAKTASFYAEKKLGRYLYVGRIANTTLLKKGGNIEAGNKSFHDKIAIYKDFGDGLTITNNDIIGDVFSNGNVWNEYAIDNRAKKLTKEFNSIWGDYKRKDKKIELYEEENDNMWEEEILNKPILNIFEDNMYEENGDIKHNKKGEEDKCLRGANYPITFEVKLQTSVSKAQGNMKLFKQKKSSDNNFNDELFNFCQILYVKGMPYGIKNGEYVEQYQYFNEEGKSETDPAIIRQIEKELKEFFNQPAWQDYKDMIPKKYL